MSPSAPHRPYHRSIRRGRLAGAALAAVVAAGALAACGSSHDDSPQAQGSQGPVSLTVGVASPSTNNADFYWALEQGIFERLGLNVKTVVQGAVESTTLAAGQLVVGNFGTTGMFPAIESGRRMSQIISSGTGNAGASITVRKNSPYQSPTDLSGKSVGVVGSSGQAYGAAASWSNYIVSHGGKALKIVVEPNVAGIIAALNSDSIDAAVGTPIFGGAIAAGLDRTLVASSDPLAQTVTGGAIDSVGYYGMTSLLKKNSLAITRFVAGMRIADVEIQKASDGQVATAMQKNETFAPSAVPYATLLSQVPDARFFWAEDQGAISEDLWKKSLAAFSGWGLNVSGLDIDLDGDSFSYANAVDMSYWNAATPQVNDYLAKSEAADLALTPLPSPSQ